MLQYLFILFMLVGAAAKAQDSSIVYFDFDKGHLTPQAHTVLDNLLKRTDIQSIVIHGHTDQLGTPAYNQKLSERRAASVKEYLVSNGFNEARITTIVGFGKAKPFQNKIDEASRALNRRVVLYQVVEATAVQPEIEQAPPQPVQKPVAQPEQQPVTQPEHRKEIKEHLVDQIKDTTTTVGSKIVLRNVNFYGGRHVFLPRAKPALQELLQAMREIPTLEIEIHGHICCVLSGGDAIDIDTGEPRLSVNRAKAVYNFLVKNGIDKSRMSYKGFGRRKPIIAYERTEEEATVNRRVEIKIIRK